MLPEEMGYLSEKSQGHEQVTSLQGVCQWDLRSTQNKTGYCPCS